MSYAVGVYTPATGAQNATSGKVIASATWNSIFNDLATAMTQLGEATVAPPTSALTLVNGLNSNIALTTTMRMRITGPTGAFSLGGFVAPAAPDGIRLWVYNPTSQTMTIVNQDGSSSAANRISTLTGQNVVLQSSEPSYATFSYDATDTKWILESYNTGAMPAPTSGSVPGIYNTTAVIASFGLAAGDIATIAIPLPVSISNYQVGGMLIGNATGTLAAVAVSLYTGAGATGTLVISSTATTVTTSLVNTANATQVMVGASANITMYSASQLFLHVTTSNAAANAADVTLQIKPVL